MKHSHHCPKCDSSDIIKIAGPASVGYSQNKIPTGWISSGNVDRYVCGECGFSEEWIAKKEVLQKLKKRYRNKGGTGDQFV